ELRCRAAGSLLRPHLAPLAAFGPDGRAPAGRGFGVAAPPVVPGREPRRHPGAAGRPADHPAGRPPDHGRLPGPRLALPPRPVAPGPAPAQRPAALRPRRSRRGPGGAARLLSLLRSLTGSQEVTASAWW